MAIQSLPTGWVWGALGGLGSVLATAPIVGCGEAREGGSSSGGSAGASSASTGGGGNDGLSGGASSTTGGASTTSTGGADNDGLGGSVSTTMGGAVSVTGGVGGTGGADGRDRLCTYSTGGAVGTSLGNGCTAIGCSNGVSAFKACFADGTPLADVQSYLFEACWREHCWAGELKDLKYTSGERDPDIGPLPDSAPRPSFDVTEFPGGILVLTNHWASRYPDDLERVDGDVFRYSVRDAAGSQVLGEEITVRWETYNPNPHCPPSVPSTICWHAIKR